MKKMNWRIRLVGLGLAVMPYASIAAPAYSPVLLQNSDISFWTGPYAGGQIGINEAGGAGISSETALTGGLYLGYNAAIPIQASYSPLILGADAFVELNGQTTHVVTGFHPVATDFGSDTYGIDALAGLPVGINRRIMPFLKLGFGTIDGTGDLIGSDTNVRIGLGAEYRLDRDLGITAQWMHQDADRITNDNFTVGLNYRFSAY